MKQIIFYAILALTLFVGITRVEAAQIHCAAGDGNPAGVEQQLKNRVDVNLADANGYTALIWAAFNGRPESIPLLMKHGANVDHVTNSGNTALLVAAGQGHTNIVQLLIEHGANMKTANIDRNTALIMAARNGHTEIVKALLPYLQKIDLLAVNKDGMTALEVAKTNDIRTLIQNRINEQLRRDMQTKSARNVA